MEHFIEPFTGAESRLAARSSAEVGGRVEQRREVVFLGGGDKEGAHWNQAGWRKGLLQPRSIDCLSDFPCQ